MIPFYWAWQALSMLPGISMITIIQRILKRLILKQLRPIGGL
jgi:hypothetical protein